MVGFVHLKNGLLQVCLFCVNLGRLADALSAFRGVYFIIAIRYHGIATRGAVEVFISWDLVSIFFCIKLGDADRWAVAPLLLLVNIRPMGSMYCPIYSRRFFFKTRISL